MNQPRTWLAISTCFGACCALVSCASLLGLPNESDPARADPDANAEASDDAPLGPDTNGNVKTGPHANDSGDTGPAGEAAACPGVACADFYVDPAGGAGRFRTIHDALIAAGFSSAPLKTIHVAAGTYTRASGEVFPIDLHGGLSLEGPGAGLALIRGDGSAYVASPSISADTAVTATILVGDPEKRSEISHVTLQSEGVQFASGYEAIICDRGNASAVAPAAPNTILNDLQIDGFEIGVRVMQSSDLTMPGCSLALTRSALRNGGIGVFAEGTLLVNGQYARVSVHLGDDTIDGGSAFDHFNVRANQYAPSMVFNGAALILRDGVTDVLVRGNRVRDSDLGVWALVTSPEAETTPGLVIENNDFGPLANAGLTFAGNVVIESLAQNNIHDVSTFGQDSNMFWEGTGLILDDAVATANLYPTVKSARDNTVFGNDLGVELRTMHNTQVATGPFDFGTAAAAGGNTFRCNSRPHPSVAPFGADVRVTANAAAGVTFSFVGNVWDHLPPSSDDADKYQSAEGIDLFAKSPPVDVGGAKSATEPPCPPGKVAGP